LKKFSRNCNTAGAIEKGLPVAKRMTFPEGRRNARGQATAWILRLSPA
jgi:hypothetical protein